MSSQSILPRSKFLQPLSLSIKSKEFMLADTVSLKQKAAHKMGTQLCLFSCYNINIVLQHNCFYYTR